MQKEYKIESGIPIPPRSRLANKSKYPFSKLKKGDSFIVEFNGTPKARVYNRVATAMYCKNKVTKRYTLRALPEGIRVWRVV